LPTARANSATQASRAASSSSSLPYSSIFWPSASSPRFSPTHHPIRGGNIAPRRRITAIRLCWALMQIHFLPFSAPGRPLRRARSSSFPASASASTTSSWPPALLKWSSLAASFRHHAPTFPAPSPTSRRHSPRKRAKQFGYLAASSAWASSSGRPSADSSATSNLRFPSAAAVLSLSMRCTASLSFPSPFRERAPSPHGNMANPLGSLNPAPLASTTLRSRAS